MLAPTATDPGELLEARLEEDLIEELLLKEELLEELLDELRELELEMLLSDEELRLLLLDDELKLLLSDEELRLLLLDDELKLLLRDEELKLLLLDDELKLLLRDEELRLLLLDDKLKLLLRDEELRLLLLDEEILLDELIEEDLKLLMEEDELLAREHSFTPPETLLPKVVWEQTKSPVTTLYTNLSALPKATLVGVDTEQVFPSLQKVLNPAGRFPAVAALASTTAEKPIKKCLMFIYIPALRLLSMLCDEEHPSQINQISFQTEAPDITT